MIAGAAHGEIRVGSLPPSFFDELITEEELEMPSDRVARLIGSGDSKVAVSLELKDKDMGSGYGAFVTVSLTCDGSEEGVDEAAELALGLANAYVQDAFQVARNTYLKADRD